MINVFIMSLGAALKANTGFFLAPTITNGVHEMGSRTWAKEKAVTFFLANRLGQYGWACLQLYTASIVFIGL